jgi:hypothetical protein
MRIERAYAMANKGRLQFLEMERSLRASGFDLPHVVFPYDENTFDLPKGSGVASYSVASMVDVKKVHRCVPGSITALPKTPILHRCRYHLPSRSSGNVIGNGRFRGRGYRVEQTSLYFHGRKRKVHGEANEFMAQNVVSAGGSRAPHTSVLCAHSCYLCLSKV